MTSMTDVQLDVRLVTDMCKLVGLVKCLRLLAIGEHLNVSLRFVTIFFKTLLAKQSAFRFAIDIQCSLSLSGG